MEIAPRLHHDHGLVVDGEVPLLNLLIGGAKPPTHRETLLSGKGEPSQEDSNEHRQNH